MQKFRLPRARIVQPTDSTSLKMEGKEARHRNAAILLGWSFRDAISWSQLTHGRWSLGRLRTSA